VTIHEDGNIIGIDIDDCRDPESGVIDEPVRALLSDVDTYVEVSPSGTGLRVFVLGESDLSKGTVAELPGEAHVEMYDTGRYLTVTGHRLDKYSTEDVHEDKPTINQFEALMSDDTTLDDY